MHSKRALKVVGIAVAGLLAAACGDDEEKSTPFTELLFVSDTYTLRTVDASGSTLRNVGAATLPGVPGAYAREGSTVTVTIPEHGLDDGFWVDLVFSAGTGGTATSGLYPITTVDADTFTIQDTASGTITGGKLVRKFVTTRSGTYAQEGTTVTITLAEHGFTGGEDVRLDFTSGTGVDTTVEVASVVDANSFTITAAADATTTGNVTVSVGTNYAIFGMAMHPSGKWVYTTSTYECWSGDPLCWGSGLISRFAVDWSKGQLAFEESVTSGRSYTAPVSLVFSENGALLFNQDDELDGIDLWSVDTANGRLTHLASSLDNDARLHGLVLSDDGTRLYNGNNVFSFNASAPASITRINTGIGSNSCTIVNGTLYSSTRASGVWSLKTYSLTNPDVPAEVGSVSTAAVNEAREIVVSPDGGLVVTAGFAGLKSYTYANNTFTEAMGTGDTEYIDGFDAWPDSSAVRKMFRSLTVNGAGDRLAAAYFTNDPDSDVLGGLPPAGVMLFSLAPDGSIAKLTQDDQGIYSRAARFFTKP